jgi:hypothetical protein
VLKKIVFSASVLVALGFQSCSEPTHPDSERLCNCYTQVYRSDEDKVDAIADSCNAIYSDIIKALESNAEEKAKFDEAYAACQ